MPAPRFHPLTRLFFCALGLLGVSVLIGLMLLVGSALGTAWTGRQPSEQLFDLATRFALPLTVLSYPANLLWIYFCRLRFDQRSMVSLGLRARRAVADGARGALVGALAIGLLWSILWLTGAVSVGGWSPEAFEMGVARALAALVGYAILFFAVGFFEETLFRGYALHNLHHWLGWRGAVAMQAIVFAIVHLGNAVGGSAAARLAALSALPQLCLIAIFFALCYRKTGSLWFPIGFHFAWNFCLGCVFSLPVSGIKTFRLLDVASNPNNWLSGGAFGAEGSFLLIPILLALIYYISRAPDHPQALLDLELLNRADPTPAVVITNPVVAIPEIEVEPSPPRENRFGTKFGTSQGFSADTLRELRELQEAREREQAEQREAARRDALAQLNAPAVNSNPVLPTPLADSPPLPEVTAPAETRTEPTSEAVAPASTTPSETRIGEVKTETPTPPQPPAAEPIKKKPPAPRW